MLTYNIGLGGDFADLGLLWWYLWTTLCGGNNATPLPDSVEAYIISNFTENTGMFLGIGKTIKIGGKSFSIFNSGKYLSTFANNTIKHNLRTTVGTVADVINITGLRISTPQSTSNRTILMAASGNQGNKITVNYKDIVIIGTGTLGNDRGISLVDDYRWANTTVLNCMVEKLGYGIMYDDLRPPNAINYIENCVSHNCGRGYRVFGQNTINVKNIFKNCVSSGSTISDWTVATALFTEITNCADSDNSIASTGAILTDNITGITDSDFVTVNTTSNAFLKINIASALYGTGTTSISAWNTQDLDGWDRPGLDTLVSIGAYEGALKTHTIVIENGLVKSWDIVEGGLLPTPPNTHEIVIEKGLIKTWTISSGGVRPTPPNVHTVEVSKGLVQAWSVV